VLRYTTDLITEFRPGTSPPPVRMPIRFATMHPLCTSMLSVLHDSNGRKGRAEALPRREEE
jgi:hypothetical protein